MLKENICTERIREVISQDSLIQVKISLLQQTGKLYISLSYLLL